MWALLIAGLSLQEPIGAGAEPFGAQPPAPLFVENAGQWPEPVVYGVPGSGAVLRRDGIGLVLAGAEGPAASVHLIFEGASCETRVEPLDPSQTRFHFLLGGDASAWRPQAPAARAVVYRELHPGVDLVVREAQGRPEYDLLVEAGADPSAFTVRADGVDDLSVDGSGALVARTPAGELHQERPRAWAISPEGARRSVAVRFRLLGARQFGFELGPLDPAESLCIDPGLAYSTFLLFGEAAAIGVDASGSATFMGAGGALPIAATPGAYDETVDGSEAIVAKLTPDGSALVYATYFGAVGNDQVFAGLLDALGRVTIAGNVGQFSSFPATPGAFDSTYHGNGDGWVARLDASGSSLLLATILGGISIDRIQGLDVDAAGATYVTGITNGDTWPTTPGSFAPIAPSSADIAFVTKLSPNGGSLRYSTYLGGTDGDVGYGLAVDPLGQAVAVGFTFSSDFPTTPGAFDTTFEGITDGFVSKLDSTGSSLVFSTYLGGSSAGGAFGSETQFAVTIDPAGFVYVAGGSASYDFPTTPNAFRTTSQANFANSETFEGTLVKFDPSGALVFATFLDGNAHLESARGVAVNVDGTVVVGGMTGSLQLPTTAAAVSTTFAGGQTDGFLQKLDPTGSGLLYGTYLGGDGTGLTGSAKGNDEVRSVALDASGSAYVTGGTFSPNFPTTPGSFQPSWIFAPSAGTRGIFVSKLDLPEQVFGASSYGTGVPGCSGSHWLGANEPPAVGTPSFRLLCSNAPPASLGLALVSDVASATGGDPFGIGVPLWVDLFGASEVLALDFLSDSWGNAWAPAPIPANPLLAGRHYFVQALWAWPSGTCTPSIFGLSISRGLELVVQP